VWREGAEGRRLFPDFDGEENLTLGGLSQAARATLLEQTWNMAFNAGPRDWRSAKPSSGMYGAAATADAGSCGH